MCYYIKKYKISLLVYPFDLSLLPNISLHISSFFPSLFLSFRASSSQESKTSREILLSVCSRVVCVSRIWWCYVLLRTKTQKSYCLSLLATPLYGILVWEFFCSTRGGISVASSNGNNNITQGCRNKRRRALIYFWAFDRARSKSAVQCSGAAVVWLSAGHVVENVRDPAGGNI